MTSNNWVCGPRRPWPTGCVYYVTPGCEVICAEAHDGRVLWRFDLMAKLGVTPSYCNIGSPLVTSDLVFVVTGNGQRSLTDLAKMLRRL